MITAPLPCPFCGSPVTVDKVGEYKDKPFWQVECDCGAIAGSAYTEKEEAVKNWNRRAEK